MIWSHFRQKAFTRQRRGMATATVSKPPSDNEQIQVVAEVHEPPASEPPVPEAPAPEPPAPEPLAQGTGAIPKRWTRAGAPEPTAPELPAQGSGAIPKRWTREVQAKLQAVTVTAQ